MVFSYLLNVKTYTLLKIMMDKSTSMWVIIILGRNDLVIIDDFRRVFKELIEGDEKTQRELSVIFNTAPCMIVKWKDQIKDLHLSTLLKIADYFECSLEYLCGKTPTELDYIPKPCPAFGEWLPEVLKQAGKSTYMLFNQTKILRSQYHKWRHCGEPMLSSLEVLARYLNVTLDHLVGRDR